MCEMREMITTTPQQRKKGMRRCERYEFKTTVFLKKNSPRKPSPPYFAVNDDNNILLLGEVSFSFINSPTTENNKAKHHIIVFDNIKEMSQITVTNNAPNIA